MADKYITQEQWDEIVSYTGDKVGAIKKWRLATGDGLKEAKTAIECFQGWGGQVTHTPVGNGLLLYVNGSHTYYVKEPPSNKYTALQQAMLDLVKAQTALTESINRIINDTQENS